MNEETELTLYAVYRIKKDGTKELLCRGLAKFQLEAFMFTTYKKEIDWAEESVPVVLSQIDGVLKNHEL